MEIANQQQKVLPSATQEEIISSLVLEGDISKMTPVQKVEYYNSFCRSLELNPLTQPFEIINLKGKLRMYATKSCTEQLRRINLISVTDLTSQVIGDIFTVTAKGTDRSGRVDASTASISIKGLSGENLANALMKCETKAKRRLTLSLCGLGILDETEIDSVKHTLEVNPTTTNNAHETPNAPQESMATDDDFNRLMFLLNCPDLGAVIFTERGTTPGVNKQVVINNLQERNSTGKLEKSKAEVYIKSLEDEIGYILSTKQQG